MKLIYSISNADQRRHIGSKNDATFTQIIY